MAIVLLSEHLAASGLGGGAVELDRGRFVALRTFRRKKQKDVAKALGITPGALSQIERKGNLGLARLLLAAALFDVPPSEIIYVRERHEVE